MSMSVYKQKTEGLPQNGVLVEVNLFKVGGGDSNEWLVFRLHMQVKT